jgi:putative endonuclease
VSRTVGDEGEDAAVMALEGAGYQIIERNYFARVGEIDIVAKDGEMLCFIEVKKRAYNSFGGGEAAISKSKIVKILKAARIYLYQKRLTDCDYRLDAVIITGDGVPQIIKNIYIVGLA